MSRVGLGYVRIAWYLGHHVWAMFGLRCHYATMPGLCCYSNILYRIRLNGVATADHVLEPPREVQDQLSPIKFDR